MSRLSIFILLCFFVTACSQGEVPKGVLPPQKMKAVLWDAMLADEMADYYVQKDSSLHALTEHASLYQKLFQIHKITKEDFKRSLQYYEKRPDLLKPIFDSLQKRSDSLTRHMMPAA